ncbi:hypothetical protein LOD99_7898 [Oopsacas minuta]|uniref:Mannose-P-dolichol utilization defect 1 protein homolog n=1 Tax=Oopsacas minuta TaxID=111878 RepID=A0AAV7JJM8_9METZ|nr:hypothetical protein LOD99_7898 [Oopsacas minuta]
MVSLYTLVLDLQIQMQDYFSSQLGPHCSQVLLERGDYSDQECTSLAISKLLGICVVLGSSLVKLPQVITILVAGSTEGLSSFSLYAELLAFIFTWGYSAYQEFPFTTWGESMFLTLQNAIIILLGYTYARDYLYLFLFPLCLVGSLSFLLSNQLPAQVYFYLQACVIPLAILGKLKQIQKNYSNSSTGQLSLIMVALLLNGTIIRMFTTVKETSDMLTLFTYVISALLNLSLVLQIIYYRKSDKKDAESKKKT